MTARIARITITLFFLLPVLKEAQAAIHLAALDTAREIEFNIPAQDLDAALVEFSKQASLQVVTAGDDVKSLKSDGIKGKLSISQALSGLLKSSGLAYKAVGESAISIGKFSTTATSEAKTTDTDTGAGAIHALHLAQADTAQSQTEEEQKVAEEKENTPDSIKKQDELAEVVVTGSHIRGVINDSSPLVSFDRGDIDRSGAATIEQFLRTVPQNFSSIGSETVLNAGNNTAAQQNITRGSSVDLRGLGAGSTLVLVNGHRLAPSGFDGSFVDVSLIPLSAVKRVDVLTDGASAVYGADAVGGVVNFVLRDDFTGAETSLRGSATTRGGAGQKAASQLLGHAWGHGSMMLAYDYNQQDGLDAVRRDFIPDLGGPAKIVPYQRRNSVFAAATASVTSSATLYGEAFYSKRDFKQSQTFIVLSSLSSGDAEQMGGVIGLRSSLRGDWQIDVSGDVAELSEKYITELEGGEFLDPIRPKTKLWSAEARADGTLFSTPMGAVKGSFGASFRQEQIDDLNLVTRTTPYDSQRRRNVLSAFGEIFVPLIGESTHGFIRRLDLSLAARYDGYETQNIGGTISSTSPKVGLAWKPIDDINLRASFTKSFRVAPLAQINEQNNGALIVPLDNSESDIGQTVTLLLSGSNKDLRPESSRSFTFGADFSSRKSPWSGSITYFHIDYSDRISPPPVVGSDFLLFSQLDTLAPFVDPAPTASEISSLYQRYEVQDYAEGATPEAIFDGRLQNISSVVVSGIDVSLEYGLNTKMGSLHPYAHSTYLIGLNNRAASTTTAVDLRNTIFQPSATRVRAGVDWSYGSIGSSVALNRPDTPV